MDENISAVPRSPTLFEALVPVAALVVLVGLSFFLFGDAGVEGPNQVALTLAALVAALMAVGRGHRLEAMTEAATASVASGIGAIFILFAVGALIGAWALSGTLLAMVYYGLKLLDPGSFYVTATALAALISFSIGSSWTVVGTIGVGLMGISANMGLDPAITAAAIISGAYFGDTTSPLSDSVNLAAASAGAGLYEHMRHTLPTSFGALGLSLVIFWLLGTPGTADISGKLAAIEAVTPTGWYMFLPLALIIVLALLKLPPFTTIFAGALAGGVLAVVMSPDRVLAFAAAGPEIPGWLALVKGVWLALASGYVSSSGDAAIDALASRGGMESMLPTIWLVVVAFAFGGVVEKTGVLDRIVTPIVSLASSLGSLVAAMVAAVLASNIITADQYLSIVLPARMFRPEFERRGLAPVLLSRAVGAAATPTSALVPWNSCGAYMAATLGVATLSYAPYAVFGIASPLLAILVARFSIAQRTGEAA
ncbi:NhaC family Na+:H+ antiporter [Pseudochelatococcus lubricantis]|uniref:NhaC family Na+:H+ antiporter n=1 Tax=Pseudochelatococcus lubricantis TaxID=1538102 RepID=A0ABX0V045_9HYPH|nr:Na+/H+ antiporter NhaC family protein [Pseudochelatococcus lubricantis]NIJ57510.1 NhaC family Na+:H+ antiporter [Pseudochelatococcus lubricantis]